MRWEDENPKDAFPSVEDWEDQKHRHPKRRKKKASTKRSDHKHAPVTFEVRIFGTSYGEGLWFGHGYKSHTLYVSACRQCLRFYGVADATDTPFDLIELNRRDCTLMYNKSSKLRVLYLREIFECATQ